MKEQNEMIHYSVVVVAAGKGTRMGLDYNKLFVEIEPEKTILDKTLDIFLKDGKCRQIIVVTNDDDIQILKERYKSIDIDYVIGGQTRQASVYNGLKSVKESYVLIHDGARPFLSQMDLDKLVDTLHNEVAAILGVKAIQTIKLMKDGYIVDTIERNNVVEAQTPQAFKSDLILECHQKAIVDRYQATDDSQLFEKYAQQKVKFVEGSYENIKITTHNDLK